MIFNKKKFYTLLDIKNQIVFTPLIFVFILSIISFILIYIFLAHEKKSKIDLINQNNSFVQQTLLKNYIGNVKYDASANFDNLEIQLSNSIYEIIGFINSSGINTQIDVKLIKTYLEKLEEKYSISFMVFNSKSYELIYGDDVLEHLRQLTNSKIQTTKFTHHMLKNIQYIGDENFIYWLDTNKRAIQLSFFKNLKNVNWFIGAFSKVDDMKALIEKAIYDSLVDKSKTLDNAYFYFYDENNRRLINYKNKSDITYINKEDALKLIKGDLNYEFKKYHYRVFIKNKNINKLFQEINDEFQTKLIMGYLIVIFVALLLITASNIFGRFINTIFNRYNRRLERRNLLFKKWKERYELAFIASNDGLWDMNLKTKEIFFSNKWLEMFGYQRGEIQIFDDWINLIHEEDKENVLKEYKKHIDKKSEHFICEYRIKGKNGNYKWVLVRGKEFNSNRMLMMSMDIDRRKQLTKELREVQSLTEFGRIVVFRWNNDEDLSVKFVSKSISSYGYDIEDFELGKISFKDFVYKDDLKQLKMNIKNALIQNLNSFTSIYRVVDKSNNIKWVYNRTILVKDDHGKVTSFYGYLNDITKIKTNEEELKIRVKQEVEKNLEKDRLLVQQNKLASMGEMLGNIAHQWRQPLNNINLIIHFLRDSFGKLPKEDFVDYVKDAKLQIDYMSQTIDDFRNFYKPSKQICEFNIKDSIIQSSKIIATSFEKNSIKLEINGDDNINISSYENEFQQVIVNILNNVVDAKINRSKTEKFDAIVKINILKQDNKVRISIFNNCGNIDENIIERIFEPYFTTKFENQGTGIGLYMTKVIVEKNMKGIIEAKNIDDGVEFLIILNS